MTMATGFNNTLGGNISPRLFNVELPLVVLLSDDQQRTEGKRTGATRILYMYVRLSVGFRGFCAFLSSASSDLRLID